MAVLDKTIYSGSIGQAVVFDATGSYGVGADIVEYKWDLDFDGVFERTTTAPLTIHRYNTAVSGIMQLKVVDQEGREGTMSAMVQISPDSAPVYANVAPPTITSVTKTQTGSSVTLKVQWQSNDTNMAYVMIAVDGMMLGYANASQGEVDITDVDLTQDVRIDLYGMSADGAVGDTSNYVIVSSDAGDKTGTGVVDDAKTDSGVASILSVEEQTSFASPTTDLEDVLSISGLNSLSDAVRDAIAQTKSIGKAVSTSALNNTYLVYVAIAMLILTCLAGVFIYRNHRSKRDR
jgi:hypothetical protein